MVHALIRTIECRRANGCTRLRRPAKKMPDGTCADDRAQNTPYNAPLMPNLSSGFLLCCCWLTIPVQGMAAVHGVLRHGARASRGRPRAGKPRSAQRGRRWARVAAQDEGSITMCGPCTACCASASLRARLWAFDYFIAVEHEVRFRPVTAARRRAGRPRSTSPRSLTSAESGARDWRAPFPAHAGVRECRCRESHANNLWCGTGVLFAGMAVAQATAV